MTTCPVCNEPAVHRIKWKLAHGSYTEWRHAGGKSCRQYKGQGK